MSGRARLVMNLALRSYGVRHLHGILRERFILVLQVTFYADESGIHDPHGIQPGSEVASIAGYIATKAQWRVFERRWRTALREYNVPVFHMSEYNRKQEEQKPNSPYLGWSDAKRKRFLRRLIKIASKVPLAAFGSMVQTKEWDSILDDQTKVGMPVKKKRGREMEVFNPYVTCFQNFFAKFPRFLDKAVNPLVNRHTPVSDVAFVFHRHEVFGPAAEKGYEICCEILKDDRLGSITFAPVEKYLPLQAADLIAFYSRRRFARYLEHIPADEFELKLLDPDPKNPDKVYLIELSPENMQDLQEQNERVRKERANAKLRIS
jgi:hypothetical protein